MKSRAFFLFAPIALDQPGFVRAGMPSIMLSDLARMRVQTISFFLLALLACSWIVQRIWNALTTDFPRLPRLDYGKAVGLVALWGLLFVLILTMISGARELMTPGAWTKAGYTYKLAETKPAGGIPREPERRQSIDRLRIALWTYARGHEGHFPREEARDAIPEEAWRVPDPSGMRYLYVAGRTADLGHGLLAYEPGPFGADRLALFADGRVVLMSPEEIRAALAAERDGRP